MIDRQYVEEMVDNLLSWSDITDCNVDGVMDDLGRKFNNDWSLAADYVHSDPGIWDMVDDNSV